LRPCRRDQPAVADLISQIQGKIEIIFHAQQIPAALKSLGAEARISGDMVNAVLPEAQQDAALEIILRDRHKLISLTPVHNSLEEYYIQKTRTGEDRKEAVRTKENGKGAGV
jgi:hypothetical protein